MKTRKPEDTNWSLQNTRRSFTRKLLSFSPILDWKLIRSRQMTRREVNFVVLNAMAIIYYWRPAIIVDKLDQTNHSQVLMMVTLLRLLSLMTPARPLGNKWSMCPLDIMRAILIILLFNLTKQVQQAESSSSCDIPQNWWLYLKGRLALYRFLWRREIFCVQCQWWSPRIQDWDCKI